MTYIGTLFVNDENLPCGDFRMALCVDKKAHVSYGCGVEGSKLAGLAWSVSPCDGSCVQKKVEVPGEIVADLEAFLQDGLERSGTNCTAPAEPEDEAPEEEQPEMTVEERQALPWTDPRHIRFGVSGARRRRWRVYDDYDDEKE